MTVVRDDARGIVAWMPVGTIIRAHLRPDGREMRAEKDTMFTTELVPVEQPWRDSHLLKVATPGQAWSLWVFFDGATGAFERYYVNLERPYERDSAAVYTEDYVLDICVGPDRTHWRKDEDELVLAVEQGYFTEDQAAAILTIAEEVESVIDAWGSPFRDGWENFLPDPAWPMPTLQRGPS